jgi:cytochrome c biogenesis factor
MKLTGISIVKASLVLLAVITISGTLFVIGVQEIALDPISGNRHFAVGLVVLFVAMLLWLIFLFPREPEKPAQE